MNFLHPEFLWLAPLVAAPIIIHLLTRLRYRRVRWAAIDFLLTSERKAIRRARLQQILLMILRTLVLAAALLALLEPILRGSLGRLLGGGSKMVVLLDGSASMSSATVNGSAFKRGQQAVLNALSMFPRGASVAFGVMAGETQITSREPLRNLQTVRDTVGTARITDGAGDVPQAIRAAAETLQRTGGGGVIWILTDSQAADWRAADPGAWQTARQALAAAGQPQIVVAPLERSSGPNYSVAGVSLSPPVPMEGDTPRVTVSVQLNSPPESAGGGQANVALYFDGERVDAASISFREPGGKADRVFRLPQLTSGTHAGCVQLDPDAIPADNRYYFTVNTEERVPILIVDGAPAAEKIRSSAHLIALALKPPEGAGEHRSPYAPTVADNAQLTPENLKKYDAVFLADVNGLTDPMRQAARDYVAAGGLLVIFPGEKTSPAEFSDAAKFPNIVLRPMVAFPPEGDKDKRAKVLPAATQDPLVATLTVEGLNRLLVAQLWPIETLPAGAQVLLSTDAGQPFLVRQRLGKGGEVFFFAVSAEPGFSTLPFTPVFLPTLHRMLQNHILEARKTAHIAFAPLLVPVRTDLPRILTPDGRVLPLMPMERDPSRAEFTETGMAGIYRLTTVAPAAEGPKPTGGASQPIIAAVNPPPEESGLEKIADSAVTELLAGSRVSFMPAGGDLATAGHESAVGAFSFPFAVLALFALLASVILAWAIDRPAPAPPEDAAAVEKRRWAASTTET